MRTDEQRVTRSMEIRTVSKMINIMFMLHQVVSIFVRLLRRSGPGT